MSGPGGIGPNVDVGGVAYTGVKLGCLPGVACWRNPEVVDWKNPETSERAGGLRILLVETD